MVSHAHPFDKFFVQILDRFRKSCIMVMQCTANSAGECHLDVVEVEGSNPPPCKQEGSPIGLPFLFNRYIGV